MSGIMQDLRHALRSIRRAPAFTATAVLCLAAGIGVNAAAFSVLDAFLMRSLPGVERQGEINTLMLSYDTRWGRLGPAALSPIDWAAFRDAVPAFERTGVVGYSTLPLRLDGVPTAARVDFVSGGLFATLGTRPALGRLIGDEDDRAGGEPVAVLGHDHWTHEFDQRPDVVGQLLHVGDVSFTIIGVAPPGFTGLYPGELIADPRFGAPYAFLPLATAPLVRTASRYASEAESLEDNWLMMAGRRRAVAGTGDVAASASAAAARLAADYPRERTDATPHARTASSASSVEAMTIIGFVMAIPLVILLVACANLANQLLARGLQRSREIAVRLSLGAARSRIVRLLLVESLLIAFVASVGGVVLARVLTDLLGAWFLVLPFRIPVDGRVALFAGLLGVVTAAAFGVVPALRATKVDLAQAMKEGSGTGGLRRSRLRGALVSLQVGASVALLALTALFVRASGNTHRSGEGATDRLLTIDLDLDLVAMPREAGQAFQALAMERLRGLPGVEAVALAPFSPISSIREDRIAIEGDAPDRQRYENIGRVRGDWFAARALAPIAGRTFTASEADGAATVAVIDRTEAEYLWDDAARAIGKAIRIGDGDSAIVATVVGVVPDIPDPRGEEPEGVIYLPTAATYDAKSRLYVRTAGSAAAMREPARAAVRALDARLPVLGVRTLGESLDEAAAPVTEIASGAGAMGIVALLLAALGLSAVLSFLVEQRRAEIGIRMALGASRRAVLALILRESAVLVGIGAAVGIAVAVAVGTLLRNLLFGVPPLDPLALGSATAVMLVVALAASLAPALRASRVDPMVAIRAE